MACSGNQYGGLDQTLFLGCSIISFAANAGWNEQSTEITVELAEDDCASPPGHSKTYWDLTLTEQQWTNADAGFMGDSIDIIGMPAYFRFKDFEFTGLIQSHERVNSSEGKRYIVKLVSPVSILENTKLIIGEYAGTVRPSAFTFPFGYNPHNIINIFGYAEAQGVFCPLYSQTSPGFYEQGDLGIDGATFGTPAGGFGGSLLNSNGMPWYMIRNLFNVLVNAFPLIGDAVEYSPNGRITGKSFDIVSFGSPWDNGFGIISSDGVVNGSPTASYFIDLSELPIVPDYLRFNQSEVSILEAISRVCQEAGHDFYIELLPVVDLAGASGSGITKFIKIRTVSRISSPVFGAVDGFINESQNNGILKSSTSGREFRNEVNSKFVVGGLKQTVYQAYQNFDPFGDGQPPNTEADDMIVPFFGTNSSGNMIVPTLDASGDWEFTVDTDNIESSLQYASFSGNPITINERELRASLSQDLWATYIYEANTETNQALDSILDLLEFPSFERLFHRQIRYRLDKFREDGIIVQNSGFFEGVGRDFNMLSSEAIDLTDPINRGIQQDTQKIHEWVSNFANNYYGTKFAVRVPFSCVYQDTESNQILVSEQPTQDGGWTEQLDVMGLPLNSDALTFFRNGSNKIETIIAYTGFDNLDVSKLDPESYVVYDNSLYLRGNVDPEYVYHDVSDYDIPRAIVDIPSLITTGVDDEAAIIHSLIKLANMFPGQLNPDVIEEAHNKVANKGSAVEILDKAFVPEGVSFGVKSNVNTYGPWVRLGPVGGIEVEKDDGLTPWEYGGYTNLNLAGDALANANVTNMQVGEMGSIGIVGVPEIPLGAELNSLSALGGNQLVENRVVSTGTYNGVFANGSIPFSQNYFVFDYGFSQSGVNGPTVTSINVNVGTEITTQYQLRTYTPKFGRFARLNSERLKEVNQNRMKYVRDLRSYVRETAENKRQGSLTFKDSLKGDIGKRRQTLANQVILARSLTPGTPHELFVGQMINWGEGKRTIMSTSSFNELPTELTVDSFENKSIASFDVLMSPVSIKGAGGLPKLITPLTDETGTFTGSTIANEPITQVDLNPYVNPRLIDPSGITNRRYDHIAFGDTLGHGFDLVGRANNTGTGELTQFDPSIPSGGLSMYDDTGTLDYRDDYKTIALKGPILLHQWGYTSDNYPIPNKIDTADAITSGIYETTGLTGTFMSGWLTRPDTWPVAPVDLRLNRDRGVWEAGGLATLVFCTATTSSNLTTQDFEADETDFFQGSDSTITGADSTIVIENRFGWDILPGFSVLAMRAAGGGSYIAYQVQCS